MKDATCMCTQVAFWGKILRESLLASPPRLASVQIANGSVQIVNISNQFVNIPGKQPIAQPPETLSNSVHPAVCPIV